MYGISNMQITMMHDTLGMYPTVGSRVIPAWMTAENYQNCENGLLSWIRSRMTK